MKTLIKLIALLVFINCSSTSNFSKRKYTNGRMRNKATLGKTIDSKPLNRFYKIEIKEEVLDKRPTVQIANENDSITQQVSIKTITQPYFINPIVDTPDKKQALVDTSINKTEKNKEVKLVEKKKLSLGRKIGGGLSLVLGLTFLISGFVLIYTAETVVAFALFSIFFGLITIVIGTIFLVFALIVLTI